MEILRQFLDTFHFWMSTYNFTILEIRWKPTNTGTVQDRIFIKDVKTMSADELRSAKMCCETAPNLPIPFKEWTTRP